MSLKDWSDADIKTAVDIHLACCDLSSAVRDCEIRSFGCLNNILIDISNIDNPDHLMPDMRGTEWSPLPV